MKRGKRNCPLSATGLLLVLSLCRGALPVQAASTAEAADSDSLFAAAPAGWSAAVGFALPPGAGLSPIVASLRAQGFSVGVDARQAPVLMKASLPVSAETAAVATTQAYREAYHLVGKEALELIIRSSQKLPQAELVDVAAKLRLLHEAGGLAHYLTGSLEIRVQTAIDGAEMQLSAENKVRVTARMTQITAALGSMTETEGPPGASAVLGTERPHASGLTRGPPRAVLAKDPASSNLPVPTPESGVAANDDTVFSNVGGLRLKTEQQDVARARLDALRETYSKPENRGLQAIFFAQNGVYKEGRSAVEFGEDEFQTIRSWGNSPRVLGELKGFTFMGLWGQDHAIMRDRTARQRTVSLAAAGADALIANAQADNWRMFNTADFFEPRLLLSALPTGLPERYQKPLQALMDLVRDKKKFFSHMQALEREVAERVWTTGETEDQALQVVLGRWEKDGGFKEVITLEGGLRPDDWYKMLNAGALFHDVNFKDLKRASAVNHGGETHRIQWNVVMREMRANPQAFGEVTQAAEIFRMLGDRGIIDKLDWTGVGASTRSDLWYCLFDSTKKNFSSPEYFRIRHSYFPFTGQWDTSLLYGPN